MKTIIEHIIKGQASQAASLVEKLIRQKMNEALDAERKTVASNVYGKLTSDESLTESIAKAMVAPGGNLPGTNPTIKPKHTGLQSPEGQKLRKPEQSVAQKSQALRKQVVDQRKKANTARDQAASSASPKPGTVADGKIAHAKMQAAQTKLNLLRSNTK